MNSNKIVLSLSTFSRIIFNRFVPSLTRSASVSSKNTSSNQSKSVSQGKSDGKYLADDMYNYTIYSFYDIEASMTKFRLPQPSSRAPLKPEPTPQKK